MNVRMWEHAATQANIKTLEERGLIRIGPDAGNMGCGEYGLGRMAEPMTIVEAIEAHRVGAAPDSCRALVTSGPTREAIDPVRYLESFFRQAGTCGRSGARRAWWGAALITGPQSAGSHRRPGGACRIGGGHAGGM